MRSTSGGQRQMGRRVLDYGLHMIVTDLGSENGKQGLHDMDDMVREGVASFKLFYGVSECTDGG
ncbi:MAG: hypothetical protein WDN23_11085 [Edaphobacter sp.]